MERVQKIVMAMYFIEFQQMTLLEIDIFYVKTEMFVILHHYHQNKHQKIMNVNNVKKDTTMLMVKHAFKVVFTVKSVIIILAYKINHVYIPVKIMFGQLLNKMELKLLVAEKLQTVYIMMMLKNIQLIIQNNVSQNHNLAMKLFNIYQDSLVIIQYIIEMIQIIFAILIIVKHINLRAWP